MHHLKQQYTTALEASILATFELLEATAHAPGPQPRFYKNWQQLMHWLRFVRLEWGVLDRYTSLTLEALGGGVTDELQRLCEAPHLRALYDGAVPLLEALPSDMASPGRMHWLNAQNALCVEECDGVDGGQDAVSRLMGPTSLFARNFALVGAAN